VHRWRAEVDAVAVGIGTALADDPLLTARDVDVSRQPARIVFDTHARLPLDSKLVGSIDEAPIYVVAEAGAAAERLGPLRAAGAEVIEVSGEPEERLRVALDRLGERSITSILLEGGAELAGNFLDAGEVDEARLFIAPLLLGTGRPVLAGRGAPTLAETERPLAVTWERSGADMLAIVRLREW
jgi:diaminohydroxyphosphoribosylaminopyrimidine deaminase/5-amino-6-(5-phosphoribosylamino)uracil reductase